MLSCTQSNFSRIKTKESTPAARRVHLVQQMGPSTSCLTSMVRLKWRCTRQDFRSSRAQPQDVGLLVV